jgi:MoxR-like ATPase
MKHKLLEIPKGKNLIEVKKILANGMDHSYDFEKKKVHYKPNGKEIKYSTYFIDEDLVDAVNSAIVTGRPLLLKGAPGCGKTKLAAAVAAYFHKKDFLKHYFEWHVKSRSKAKDGAYSFDHINRLREATIAKIDKENAKVKDPKNYVSLGPMGYSFRAQPKEGKTILLIDEIDKGDIDFPNDLLLELDEMRFAINELNENEKYVEADDDIRPLVIITSNDERELPPAFLRRCLYYKIPAFEGSLLKKIAASKLQQYYEIYRTDEYQPKQLNDENIEAVIEKFIKVRDGATGIKTPSTSELLDWFQLIVYRLNVKQEKIEDVISNELLRKLALKILT